MKYDADAAIGQEALYNALFDAMSGISYLTKSDGARYTIVAASPQLLALAGQEKAAVIGRCVFEVFPSNASDPNDTGATNLRSSFAHVLLHKEPHQLPIQQYDVAGADGNFTQLYWKAENRPVFAADGGEVAYILHRAEDITEQVKAAKREGDHQELISAYQKIEEREEELKRFKFMADNARDPFILMRADATFAYLNQKALEAWGYTEDEAQFIRVPNVDPIYQEAEFKAVFATVQQETIPQFETLHRRKDGYIFPVEVNMGGMTFLGEPLMFAVARDITERKKMEDSLRENEALLQRKVEERTVELEVKNKELERSNQNLEEFAYAASHDMKEPIRKIHFFTDRLRERLVHKMEEEDRRYFERLQAGANRMATLIDDLLKYSHVNRGERAVETVDLNQVLSFVMDDLELHIEEKKANIKVNHLPTIKGLPRQLQQVFENLIGNALKYSRQGIAPEIEVTSRRINGANAAVQSTPICKDNEYHLLEVRDNGIGFEQCDADRIFNVFTRLHGNTEYRGTGVGLSIVQKVIDNHQGYIWAQSTPGKGATFKVLLPIE